MPDEQQLNLRSGGGSRVIGIGGSELRLLRGPDRVRPQRNTRGQEGERQSGADSGCDKHSLSRLRYPAFAHLRGPPHGALKRQHARERAAPEALLAALTTTCGEDSIAPAIA